MNNPIPSNLKSEAKKAAKILREFTEITSRNGPDKLIPAHVIAKARGLAILSVIKAGFLVTARGGSGIVLARLPNGGWSAPSAIGIAGLGGGFEIGIEVSDLVIILNHERAVEAFAKGGNLTLGGNFTVAIGPLGRNLEGDVALRSSAAVYTYCKSRGLFAGVSLEGTCLIERKETNSKFYGRDIRASAILFGDISPPLQAQDLYDILESFTLQYEVEEGRNYTSAPVAKEPRKNYVKQQPSRTSHNTPPEAPRTSNRLYPELPKNYTAMELLSSGCHRPDNVSWRPPQDEDILCGHTDPLEWVTHRAPDGSRSPHFPCWPEDMAFSSNSLTDYGVFNFGDFKIGLDFSFLLLLFLLCEPPQVLREKDGI